MKLVKILWVDSHHLEGWLLLEDVPEIEVKNMESVGWIVKEDKTSIQIAANAGYYEGAVNQVSSIMTIPKCTIKNIIELKTA